MSTNYFTNVNVGQQICYKCNYRPTNSFYERSYRSLRLYTPDMQVLNWIVAWALLGIRTKHFCICTHILGKGTNHGLLGSWISSQKSSNQCLEIMLMQNLVKVEIVICCTNYQLMCSTCQDANDLLSHHAKIGYLQNSNQCGDPKLGPQCSAQTTS